ncbi:nucleotidyltransferase family protein [bacterium]|nr:nucleotidyltransferase family protein [bacterium]
MDFARIHTIYMNKDDSPKDNHPVVEYEQRLKNGTGFWVQEASDFFQQKSTVHNTLNELALSLKESGIPYAVVGALALGQQGFLRATVDIDILLTPEGLEKFKTEFEGKGYVRAFAGSKKSFRSSSTGVRIDVLLTGEYPGDGKPKAVAFPDPAKASFESHGISFLRLENLIELKLASGISAQHRIRDLADIQDLIREAKLPLDLAESINESVRTAYRDLWQKAQVPDPLQE